LDDSDGGCFLLRRVGAGLICAFLVACAVPKQPPLTSVTPSVLPTEGLRATATVRSTAVPTATVPRTATPSQAEDFTPPLSVAGPLSPFEGCWSLETEEVSFEVKLEEDGLDLKGTFFLVKMCLVADELTACRIREGTLLGSILTKNTSEVRVLIPEYDDEGRVRLTLAPDGATLHWEELDYPAVGLADGASRYLPPSFVLVPCGS
jgi:hypothetical protein